LYNPQLETFIRVADAGSFNKAVEWNYTIPFGILHSTRPSETVRKFLEAVKQVVEVGK